MKKLLASLAAALTMILAVHTAPADAAPASFGCVQNFGGGCINLDNDHRDPLWVHSLQPGVRGAAGWKYGHYEVWLTRKSNGITVRIKHSTDRWVNVHSTQWGPLYIIDKFYADGDIFCGDFSGWNPKERGCVTVHD